MRRTFWGSVLDSAVPSRTPNDSWTFGSGFAEGTVLRDRHSRWAPQAPSGRNCPSGHRWSQARVNGAAWYTVMSCGSDVDDWSPAQATTSKASVSPLRW
jgi:hypothetical protein